MSNSTLIDELALSGTKNGKISIATINQPYGENSSSVVSIAISLDSNSNEPDWKVHIPKDNIDELIEALKKAK
jgi:hypothetical protein